MTKVTPIRVSPKTCCAEKGCLCLYMAAIIGICGIISGVTLQRGCDLRVMPKCYLFSPMNVTIVGYGKTTSGYASLVLQPEDTDFEDCTLATDVHSDAEVQVVFPRNSSLNVLYNNREPVCEWETGGIRQLGDVGLSFALIGFGALAVSFLCALCYLYEYFVCKCWCFPCMFLCAPRSYVTIKPTGLTQPLIVNEGTV